MRGQAIVASVVREAATSAGGPPGAVVGSMLNQYCRSWWTSKPPIPSGRSVCPITTPPRLTPPRGPGRGRPQMAVVAAAPGRSRRDREYCSDRSTQRVAVRLETTGSVARPNTQANGSPATCAWSTLCTRSRAWNDVSSRRSLWPRRLCGRGVTRLFYPDRHGRRVRAVSVDHRHGPDRASTRATDAGTGPTGLRPSHRHDDAQVRPRRLRDGAA